jgi:hypothetical protein
MGITKTLERIKSLPLNLNVEFRSATLQQSKDFASTEGGRLLAPEEFLTTSKTNLSLVQRLEMKWLWLEGQGITLSGPCTMDGDRIISIDQDKWDRLPFTERIWVWNGDKPLLLRVAQASASGQCFDINATFDPSFTAHAIVWTTEGCETPEAKAKIAIDATVSLLREE